MNFDQLCLGCMREIKKGENGTQHSCPYCGFSLETNDPGVRFLAPGTILAGKYLVGKVLGQGGFGITYIGFDLNMETRIAIKEYFPVEMVTRDTTTVSGDRVLSLGQDKKAGYENGLRKYVEEARAISAFSESAGIVSVKDFFFENETAYIIMEYLDGCDLKEYLRLRGGTVSEKEALSILQPVFHSLTQIHEKGIIHRDISPDNIMLTFAKQPQDETNFLPEQILSVKLIDFGAARMTGSDDHKSLTVILKHGYAPEEQYRSHGEQGPWTDVYAISAVLYKMLTGVTPPSAMDRIFDDGIQDFGQLGLGEKISANTQRVIMQGLAVKAKDRISSVAELEKQLSETTQRDTGSISAKGDGKKRIGLVVAVAVFLLAGIGVAAGVIQHQTKKQDMQDNTVAQSAEVDELAQTESTSDAATDAVIQEASLATDTLDQENGEENLLLDETEAASDDNLLDLSEEDARPLGEAIVQKIPQTSFASCDSFCIYIREDGTVATEGSNSLGQGDVGDWNHMVAVSAGGNYAAGLREDGRVFVAGELENKEDVENWEGITQIAADTNYLFGLRSDGTIICSSTNDRVNRYWSKWTNIKSIYDRGTVLFALDYDGVVHSEDWVMANMGEITGWNEVEYMTADGGQFLVGLKSDGTVIVKTITSAIDVVVDQMTNGLSSFQNIVQVSVVNGRVIGVSSDGTVHMTESPSYVNGLRGEGNIRSAVTLFEDAKTWQGMKGFVSYGMVVRSRLIGITDQDEVLSTTIQFGDTDLQDMHDLKNLVYFNSWLGNDYVLGVNANGQVYEYSTDNNSDMYPFAGKNNLIGAGVLKHDDSNGAQYNDWFYLQENGTLTVAKEFREQVQSGKFVQAIRHKDYAIDAYVRSSKAMSYFAALSEQGTVQVFGDLSGEIHSTLEPVSNWQDIKMIAITSCEPEGHQTMEEPLALVGLKEDGTLEAAIPMDAYRTDVSGYTSVSGVYGGYGAIGLVFQDGTAEIVDFMGDASSGQFNTANWTNITSLALGKDHTVGLCTDGTVVACGNNLDGQCDVSDWKDVVQIEAGVGFTLGRTASGELLVAGYTQ